MLARIVKDLPLPAFASTTMGSTPRTTASMTADWRGEKVGTERSGVVGVSLSDYYNLSDLDEKVKENCVKRLS